MVSTLYIGIFIVYWLLHFLAQPDVLSTSLEFPVRTIHLLRRKHAIRTMRLRLAAWWRWCTPFMTVLH